MAKKVASETVKFIALKYKELRVILDPKAFVEVEGKRFSRGYNGSQNGISCQFHEGVFETSDPEVIEMLDNHAQYGVMFFRPKSEQAANPKGVKEKQEKQVLAEIAADTDHKADKGEK